AVVCMDGDGPSSGKPKYLGLILASADAVALDKVCSRIFGFKEDEIETTNIAEERGLGTADFSKIELVGEKLSDIALPKFDLPSNRFLKMVPKFMVKLLEPYVWVRPNVKEELCTNCNLCVENCPMKVIQKDSKRPNFNYAECINCLCCHELCPENAVYLEKSWLARKFIH
ncbi:MAG TPA: 4Fe-4S binding protein, partial [candidate division Zixibacteria bacterium]